MKYAKLCKKGSVYFQLCPKQGPKIGGVVLHRVCILGCFCPKQGQGLKPSAAPLYPTMGQVHPPGGHMKLLQLSRSEITTEAELILSRVCGTCLI